MALFLGTAVALGALPEVTDGAFATESDFGPFLLLLTVAFAFGFGLVITGGVISISGRARAKRQTGSSQQVRDLLSKWQRTIGLVLIFMSFIAVTTVLGQLLMALSTS